MRKKTLAVLLAFLVVSASLFACSQNGSGTGAGAGSGSSTSGGAASGGGEASGAQAGEEPDSEAQTPDAGPYADLGIENGRFVETRHITVEVFDRGLDDERTPPDSNYWSKWLEENVLRDLNIQISWVVVPRWSEEEQIVNLLAAGDAADVSSTYALASVQEYYKMGGVLDMAPYIDNYKDLTPNMWSLLGPYDALHNNRDPESGVIIAIEQVKFPNSRINTFVREDWLTKLNLPDPTNIDEFESMLVAFKDNAELLLGKDASRMIPYSTGEDVGWRNNNLLVSYVPDDISDKDGFIYGFDDRQLMFPGIKEGVRVLNKWYNMGLIWPDFSVAGKIGDSKEDDNMKAGIVGAFQHNWDYPYRNGEDSFQVKLKENTGDDAAAFVAVDPFKNDKGVHRKYLSSSFDCKVFFPATNKEPLASIMYVDYISRLDVIKYLQIGDEGINHSVTADGAIEIISAKGTDKIQNSPLNIDYTRTNNGLNLGDAELTGKSLGLSYAFVDPFYIGRAYDASQNDRRIFPQFHVGEIVSQSGMDNVLKDKRNALLNQAVNASVDQFDSVWDSGYADYLKTGGQAIIDERAEKYAQFYND